MFENHVKMGKMIDSVTAHMPLQESINPCLQYVDQDAANAPFEAVAWNTPPVTNLLKRSQDVLMKGWGVTNHISSE